MRRQSWLAAMAAAGAIALAAPVATAANAESASVKHVLLISVDGLHQSDVTQCIADKLCPTIAALQAGGTSYSDVSTSKPSDSSPGLMALATGGTPKLTGVYYDDSYDRTMFTPPAQLPTGTVQDCSGPPGAETMYAENIDTNAPSTANGGVGTRTILNESIDPAQLPRVLAGGKCVPVYPNNFLRTNSIFSVAHSAGLHTAWADKHPAADQQVSGFGTPNTIDDKFMTEINADIVPPTLTDTRGRTVTFPLPNPDGTGPYFITDKVGNTEAYDQIKVDAILNEIDGLSSNGKTHTKVPAIFGMNFQTVSVSQKLVDPQLSCVRSKNALGCDPSYMPGGYVTGTLQFTPQLKGGIASVDTQLGSMVSELKAKGLMGSTEIILTAKHGQSPIDPATLQLIGHAEGNVVTKAGVDIAQLTDDDIALMWLKDQSQVTQAVQALETDKAVSNTARVDYVLSGDALAKLYNSPSIDPRTPDLIVQPIAGTIYSHSAGKVAEHGGFATNDTHVPIIVFNGANIQTHGGTVVSQAVTTYQVAPTILATLGLDPNQLVSVLLEHDRVLPGLNLAASRFHSKDHEDK